MCCVCALLSHTAFACGAACSFVVKVRVVLVCVCVCVRARVWVCVHVVCVHALVCVTERDSHKECAASVWVWCS